MGEKTRDNTMHLIANITHQAINPIGGVIGTLDNVIDGTISENRRMQRLKSARAQLEYTVSLIRNLAFFAQYGDEGAPKKTGSFKTTVIPQNLIEAAMFFQEQGENKGVRIEIMNRDIQNSINGDPDLMRQVFMNIFDNYIKYSIANATVRIRHWIQKKTDDLIVEIEGESTPFDADEDIFELGVRGKHAEGTTSSGSGLGLHICKLIVEKVFNGTITASYVHSTNIARFEIRVPRAFVAGDSNMQDSERKILIMDDEPHVLDWLIEYVEAKGYGVKIVTNIDDAIMALDREKFRVAIFDLNVPVSIELQGKLKEKGSIYDKYRGLYAAEYARTKGHRGKQVVVYSVHDSEEVHSKCKIIGIEYLIKARPREFKKELNYILSFDPTERKLDANQ